ncbi:MAG: Saccharopine dehydrogenase [Sphingomonas bacterium]|uniref:saccharopine dehydrogenase family protein n=1 Tax=Sphingomonas bacterium TaxID=1895847 RepID=UPI002620CDB1|nr:saccharopine dehydrogenase NADP-binding domain-containing protein [Sphingomonas bacterium]MDB5708838.1 Saccharopine dehydrogenase [Sphingomonas bacterium]
MTLRVLIIGGYGNFGGYIARTLATDPNIVVLIAGRSSEKARAAAASLAAANPAEGYALDIAGDLPNAFAAIRPDLVIHTSGPFQGQDHRVARTAIAAGVHYIDMADSRDFVATIGALDDAARAAGVTVVAGASSVPCLTAAFIDRYRPAFARLDSAVYGITTAQQTNTGLGTAAAVLSYVGKPFTRWSKGARRQTHGWQGLHAVRYPEIAMRLFGDCDVPDLALFPARYPELRELRFVAGHEVKLLHLGTWLLSWFVRLGLIDSLARYAPGLLKASSLFDPLGSGRSGLHMILSGTGNDGRPMTVRIFMVARQAHGPNIPCVPSIILARRIAAGERIAPGARPCLDLIDLNALLGALDDLDITTVARGPGINDRWPAGGDRLSSGN